MSFSPKARIQFRYASVVCELLIHFLKIWNAQFAVDTSSGNLDSFFRFLKVAPSAEIELTFVIDRGDIKVVCEAGFIEINDLTKGRV